MNRIFLNLVGFFLFLNAYVQCSLSKIRLNGKYFVDEYDRVILFHGTNAVEKNPPWVPISQQNLKNKTHLQNLKDWGFNVVRVGYMWSGVYPSKGEINQTYIDEMSNIIKSLESYGMYAILDMHQDFMSTKFGSYDGVPLWVLNELPNPKHAYPWPFKKFYLGFTAYVTEACGFAFQGIYQNTSNTETYFQEFWTTVAKTYANNYSSILGYELINEPWAGDIYSNPLIALPGFADAINLMPLYDKVYEQIRKYDSEHLVFYEPVTWGVMSNNQVIGTGFDHAPQKDVNRTVFSWHYYCWLLDVDQNPVVNGSLPTFVKTFCEDWQLKTYFKTVANDMQLIGGGASFLTEFGDCVYHDPITHQVDTEECQNILNAGDEHFQSWTYWNSQFYDQNNQINYDIVNLFSRVYPKYTNGIPIALNYNSTTRFFQYVFQMNLSSPKQASYPTEIFVPLHLYSNGINITVSSNLQFDYDKENSRVLVSPSQFVLKGLYFNTKLRIKNDLGTIKIVPV